MRQMSYQLVEIRIIRVQQGARCDIRAPISPNVPLACPLAGK
jgi:hypothetical protein